jgi:hypothetical protein
MVVDMHARHGTKGAPNLVEWMDDSGASRCWMQALRRAYRKKSCALRCPPSPFRGDAANLHASISGRFARSHVRPYSSELWMPRADGLWKPSKAYLSMRVRQVPSREASVYNDGEPTRQDDRRQDKHLFLAR